jgi:hypothetical protein
MLRPLNEEHDMTLDECLDCYEDTGKTLFYTYIGDERIVAEVTWGPSGADYTCYKNFFLEAGSRAEIADIETDTWCEF